MIDLEINGIRKAGGNHFSPYEAVSHYQWVQYDAFSRPIASDITPREMLVNWLEGGLGRSVTAHVKQVAPRAYCFVNRSVAGTKFLQTHPDTTEENNLLNLQEI